MKISLRWIEEIIGQKIELTDEQLAEKLLHLGFEVSAIVRHSGCGGVVAAKILKISKHPNADRLQIAEVTDGKETQSVVCGAPNIQINQKVFWAKIGAKLCDGSMIKETPIRGVLSPGMLCSARELGVGEDHSGLFSLPENIELGTPAEEAMQLEDTILELEITPNRPDCLSQTGIAREISLFMESKIANIPASPLVNPNHSFPILIENTNDCSRYIARKLDGVAIGPSSLKIQTRLIRCGIRPINSIVDITNYILLETGHPLHAFDADQLKGKKIWVRRAKAGEKILALDGKTYVLDPSMIVIADIKKPVAIAGIMGGEETAVTKETKNILLECAVFNKSMIRNTRKKLNLVSESSYRFERGVSHSTCAMASEAAARMILNNSGGNPTAFTDQSIHLKSSDKISVRFSQIQKVLGEKINPKEIVTALKKIGASDLESNGEKISLAAPPWRLDLNLEIDFIEEIARLRGYEKTPSEGKGIRISSIFDHNQRLKKMVRKYFESAGFFESYNYGLVSKEECGFFSEPDSFVKIENPLSQEQSFLRPSLIPELVKNLKLNLSYQKKEIKLFEMGYVFNKMAGKITEQKFLGAIATGKIHSTGWQAKEPREIDFFWVKGIIQSFFKQMQIKNVYFIPVEGQQNNHPQRFEIRIGENGKTVLTGILSHLSSKLKNSLKLQSDAYFFEINMDLLETFVRERKKTSAVVRTPSISRDCSIWVEEKYLWIDIFREINKVGTEFLENCELFDLYSDPKQKEIKSLSFTLTFRDPLKTLNDETANQLRDRIVRHLKTTFNAVLREK